MIVHCIWEHNGNDTLLYAEDYAGAFARGETLEAAIARMPREIASYCRWLGEPVSGDIQVVISGEKRSPLDICDADSDVLFESEKAALTAQAYERQKSLALRSAMDFLALYASIPDKSAGFKVARKTFYGQTPRTAKEMYEHTKDVNAYYFAEIGVDADNEGDICACRKRGFETLEMKHNFLQNAIFAGSFGEDWTLRKVLRRFIWHDRIHAKAMYRMALQLFGEASIENPFCFDLNRG